MKKLTAGILTVMLGLVVADANAAITSKKYVDDKISNEVSAINTTITNNVTNLNNAIDGVKDDVTSLQGTVDALTADEGEGSIAAQIATSLEGYAKTTEVESKIETATDDMETKTHAAATYATKVDLTAEETARTTAISEMDTAYKAADAAINAKIGTIPEGKTLSVMISDAQTAATYDDTELAGRVTTIEDGAVMKSGATKEKIDAIATNTAAIEQNASDIAAMDDAYKAADKDLDDAVKAAKADATKALNESIQKISAENSTGDFVLTMKKGENGSMTFQWEDISRTVAAE